LAAYRLMLLWGNRFGRISNANIGRTVIARLGKFDRPVVVTMISMGMVQVPVDKIVDMVAMWHRLVTAPRAMNVARRMSATVVAWRALVGVVRADFELVLVYVIAMRMVQVPIVKIIDMIAMLDSGVAAVCAMLMIVMVVMRCIAGAHREIPRFTFAKPCRKTGWG
jgi:hypothetical protein